MLKRAISSVYSEYLPNGRSPFVYMSLVIPPHLVDVNVHPTKREVLFLHQELLVDTVASAVREKLLGGNQSRTFYTKTVFGMSNDSNPKATKAIKATKAAEFTETDSKAEAEALEAAPSGSSANAATPGNNTASDSSSAGGMPSLASFSLPSKGNIGDKRKRIGTSTSTSSTSSTTSSTSATSSSTASTSSTSRSSLASRTDVVEMIRGGAKKKKTGKTKGGNAHAAATYAHKLTRTDAKANTLEQYMSKRARQTAATSGNTIASSNANTNDDDDDDDDDDESSEEEESESESESEEEEEEEAVNVNVDKKSKSKSKTAATTGASSSGRSVNQSSAMTKTVAKLLEVGDLAAMQSTLETLLLGSTSTYRGVMTDEIRRTIVECKAKKLNGKTMVSIQSDAVSKCSCNSR